MENTKPGYMRLHPDQGLNFMMNRLSRTIPPQELIEIGGRISSLDDWVRKMLAAAEQAESQGRLLVASAYFRGAEFYMSPDAPRKAEAYERFLTLHDRALPDVAALRTSVAFEGGQLPVLDLPARGATKDIVLAHSGFDGLAEESYPTLLPLVEAGYRVLLFEGPGQGAALRHSGLHMSHDWERPVAAVLDHFGVESCTLVGVSLGGYLAPRAAAFEPRIERVVAWGAMYDFMGCFARGIGSDAFEALLELIKAGERATVNGLMESAGKENLIASWAIGHGMHVSGSEDPFDFFRWLMTMNLQEVGHLIGQDVLLVMGANDHLVPVEQLHQQAAALTNGRSVTTRLATAREQGAEHCQIGNPALVTDEIIRWLEGLRRRDEALTNTRDHLVSDEVV